MRHTERTWLCALFLALFQAPGAACAAAEGNGEGDDLEQLLQWIDGDFDNGAQFDAQEGDTITHLGLQRRLVNAPALGEHVVYAQINHRADPDDVYRQTLIVFNRDADGAIQSHTLRFVDAQAHADILQDLTRFETLTPEAVKAALPEGCNPVWTREEEAFVARVAREDCVMISRRDGKPRRIQSTEFVRADAILNEESGYREDGSMIFGLDEGVYYRYDRMTELTQHHCDGPVFMVVSGPTLDPKRMGAYGAKIAETGIYAEVGGYYLNAPRPIAVFDGDVDPRLATLIVRFPCLENARRFWNSKLYQETIKPLRLNPSAGNYTVTVYAEADLPEYMQGKVDEANYSADFEANLEQIAPE